jgi:hypothetical protein
MAREVKINFNYTAGSIAVDGIKAAIKKVEDLEELNATEAQTDLTAASVIVTGSKPYAVYAYTLTTEYSTASYTFTFVEQAPNI